MARCVWLMVKLIIITGLHLICLLYLVTHVIDEAEDDYDESVADVVDSVAIGNRLFIAVIAVYCNYHVPLVF